MPKAVTCFRCAGLGMLVKIVHRGKVEEEPRWVRTSSACRLRQRDPDTTRAGSGTTGVLAWGRHQRPRPRKRSAGALGASSLGMGASSAVIFPPAWVTFSADALPPSPPPPFLQQSHPRDTKPPRFFSAVYFLPGKVPLWGLRMKMTSVEPAALVLRGRE